LRYLNSIDYTVIAIYFSFLVALGLFLRSRASQNLEHYLLGGRKIPWWCLGISGMAGSLDLAGTMVIISFLYMLGPRGLFIEFRGGANLLIAVMLLWTGKWTRRSKCLTPAEWMVYRFGDGFGGRFAQFAMVVGGTAWTIGMLAYLTEGVGLFLSMFLPWDPQTCALILIVVATVYTMISGFYGVVFTDIFQSVIIIGAVIGISIMAGMKVTDVHSLGALAEKVTGNAQWTNIFPAWHTNMQKGYEQYQFLLPLAILYLMRNIFGGFGQGHDPKYFAARNDRECGTLSFSWISMMMFRWPMMLGFAILGLFMVNSLLPDQSVLGDAAALIKQAYPNATEQNWEGIIAQLVNNPDIGPELVSSLQQVLGQEEWASKMQMIGFGGDVNPERVLPAVLLFNIRQGFRGLMLIALIAASMSTFDTQVNGTAGLLVRDVYQKYLRPKASNKELIYASWASVLALVITGVVFATTLADINDIWGWLTMALGGGMLIPLILRFYWWRYNGAGFAAGMLGGVTAAVFLRLVPNLTEHWEWIAVLKNEWAMFLVTVAAGFTGSLLGTYLSEPTDSKVLRYFYWTTRPFGVWKPMRKYLPEDMRGRVVKEHKNDILALPFVIMWQVSWFLIPMTILIHNWKGLAGTIVVFLVGLGGMYIFWYRNLPKKNFEPEEKIYKYPDKTFEIKEERVYTGMTAEE